MYRFLSRASVGNTLSTWPSELGLIFSEVFSVDTRIAFKFQLPDSMVSQDPTTQSNYLDVHTTHISIDWHVDFDEKIVSGSATHRLTVVSSGVNEVM